MPDLPTLTVSQDQADTLLNAFSGQTADDGTPLTPAAAYRRWLKRQLRGYVITRQAQTLDQQADAAKQAAIAALDASLPGLT